MYETRRLPRPARSRGWLAPAGLLLACAALGVTVVWMVSPARAQEVERYSPVSRGGVRDVIADAAARHDVSPGLLIALATCESRLDPSAVGDHGSSHGLIQLSDLPTGLLGHFHDQGYATAYSAWESADYLARVASGEFAWEGVTLRRWSCWWVVR